MELKRGQIIRMRLVNDVIRLVLIVSNNKCNKFSPVITGAPLTTKVKGTPLATHVLIKREQYQNLKTDSTILVEQTSSFDKMRITSIEPTIYLSDDDMDKVDNALKIQLNLLEYM